MQINALQHEAHSKLSKILKSQDCLRIWAYLETQKEPMIVGAIYRNLNMEQSTCSQKLSDLRAFSLVKTRQSGKMFFYEINKAQSDSVKAVLSSLGGLLLSKTTLTEAEKQELSGAERNECLRIVPGRTFNKIELTDAEIQERRKQN